MKWRHPIWYTGTDRYDISVTKMTVMIMVFSLYDLLKFSDNPTILYLWRYSSSNLVYVDSFWDGIKDHRVFCNMIWKRVPFNRAAWLRFDIKDITLQRNLGQMFCINGENVTDIMWLRTWTPSPHFNCDLLVDKTVADILHGHTKSMNYQDDMKLWPHDYSVDIVERSKTLPTWKDLSIDRTEHQKIRYDAKRENSTEINKIKRSFRDVRKTKLFKD